jgi:hypothetical protein
MICERCGSNNIFTQIVTVNKRKRLPFKLFVNTLFSSGQIMFIILPVIGWIAILLLYLYGYKASPETWSICQNCGYRWEQ